MITCHIPRADVNECNTTDPIHQHNCSTGEGYQCFDLEGSFLCVNCTEREEWNGTSCVPLTTVAEDGMLTRGWMIVCDGRLPNK